MSLIYIVRLYIQSANIYNVAHIYIVYTMRAPMGATLGLQLTFIAPVDICVTVVIATIIVWFNYFTSKRMDGFIQYIFVLNITFV